VVTETGAKRWSFSFRLGGSATQRMGLGSFPEVGLAMARETARDAHEQTQKGINPIEFRRRVKAEVVEEEATAKVEAVQRAVKATRQLKVEQAKAKKVTFGYVADKLTESQERTWKGDKHRERWKRNFNIHAKSIMKMPIEDVDIHVVANLLKPIWWTKHETATKLRSQIERTFDLAEVLGYRTGTNPAQWRGRLEHLLPKSDKVRQVEHHPAVPWQRVPELIKVLRRNETITARMIEVSIYCATRPSEARLAEWVEFDLENSVWTIPASRMKSNRDHRIPLSRQAISNVNWVAGRSNRIVFSSPRGQVLSYATANRLLDILGWGEFVQHGFRSSFRDWVQDTRIHDSEIAEIALAHTVGSKTERAYRRSDVLDQRAVLMQDWSDYCTSLIDPGDHETRLEDRPVYRIYKPASVAAESAST
jgi:integrase